MINLVAVRKGGFYFHTAQMSAFAIGLLDTPVRRREERCLFLIKPKCIKTCYKKDAFSPYILEV